MYCLLSPIHHELVPKYETANFTNTLPTHFPFLFLFTFVFLASLQLDSSLYFLFFLLSAFLPLSHFVFICISLSFCLHVYFNIFGFTLPNMIPETTLRAGRSGLRIPVAQRDCPPPPKVPTGSAAQPVFYFMSTGFLSLRVRYWPLSSI